MLISFIIPAAGYYCLASGWGAVRVAALVTLVLGVALLPVAVVEEFL